MINNNIIDADVIRTVHGMYFSRWGKASKWWYPSLFIDIPQQHSYHASIDIVKKFIVGNVIQVYNNYYTSRISLYRWLFILIIIITLIEGNRYNRYSTFNLLFLFNCHLNTNVAVDTIHTFLANCTRIISTVIIICKFLRDIIILNAARLLTAKCMHLQ